MEFRGFLTHAGHSYRARSVPEIRAVHDASAGLMRTLKARGVAMIYISHRLHEIETMCDRVVVLRDGCVVHDGPPPKAVGQHALPGFGRAAGRAGEEGNCMISVASPDVPPQNLPDGSRIGPEAIAKGAPES